MDRKTDAAEPVAWHNLTSTEALDRLGVDQGGLAGPEARERLARHACCSSPAW
jgi:hypothetical protein